MWTLEEAQKLINGMQAFAKDYNYHVALGGGVLNKGKSDKDLDLYFLPIENNNNNNRPEPLELILWLGTLFGKGTIIKPGMYNKVADKDRVNTFGMNTVNNNQFAIYTNNVPAYDNGGSVYSYKIMFDFGGRRIDTFIV